MKRNKKYYPLFMDLDGLPCLVVGGGKVAERKVVTLVETGARVTVVSPEITPLLVRLKKKKRFRHLKGRYSRKTMAGMRLVVGSTGDPRVNAQVFHDAEKKGIPVNIVDQPHLCRFIVPAVTRFRDITLAITTGGSAPGVTALMRRDLEERILKPYAPLVDALKRIRPRLKALPQAQKKAFWKRVKQSPPVGTLQPPGKILNRWLEEITRKSK
jgi:siroheme synthase-like protein